MADESGSLLAALQHELKALLAGGQAHATFEQAVKDFPIALRGVVPEGLPYSAWQIVEHIRLAQRDMLHFSDNRDGSYQPMRWPEDYWPKDAAPPNEGAWDASVATVRDDRERFEKLLEASSGAQLTGPFSWGDGQSLLREALQIADHNAYHVGELVVLRRLLGVWK